MTTTANHRVFTADAEWSIDLNDYGRMDYQTIAYAGDLGGGTLRVYAVFGGTNIPLPDSKLSASTLDGQGEVVKAFPFRTTGDLVIELSGATDPNVTVYVL